MKKKRAGSKVAIKDSGIVMQKRWHKAFAVLGVVAALSIVVTAQMVSAEQPYVSAFDISPTVTIIEQGEPIRQVRTDALTVAQCLYEMGIEIGESDTVVPLLSVDIKDGMKIEIVRPFDVVIETAEGEKSVEVSSGTVETALSKAGISIGRLDEIKPAVYIPIEEGMRISYQSVSEKYEILTEKIPHDTKVIEDASLEKGKSKVVTEGRNGEKDTRYLIRHENGEQVLKEKVEEVVVENPVTEIKHVGTKVIEKHIIASKQMELKKDNRPEKKPPLESQIKRVIKMEATAYTHTGNKTATGTKPKVGTVAINPKQIPYGTKLYIEGYGYAVAEDTGAFRFNNKPRIDLFMDTYNECIKYGRRHNINVYVLK